MKKGVVAVLSLLAGGGIGSTLMSAKATKKTEAKQRLSDKHLRMFKMMNQWVKLKQEGKNLADFLKKNNYEKIAVYGMHYAGETLVAELANTDIQIVCGIDRKAQSIYSGVNMITKDDTIPDVDAIIVTAISFFDEIESDLQQKTTCPIISLEDIIYEM